VSESDRRRIARQQTARRAVNNAITAGRADVEEDRIPLLCECGALGCTTVIEVSEPDYRAVRAHARRFVVRTAHAVDGVDTVIHRYPRDAVVVEVGPDLAGEVSSE
jgi:hypothetical protein